MILWTSPMPISYRASKRSSRVALGGSLAESYFSALVKHASIELCSGPCRDESERDFTNQRPSSVYGSCVACQGGAFLLVTTILREMVLPNFCVHEGSPESYPTYKHTLSDRGRTFALS